MFLTNISEFIDIANRRAKDKGLTVRFTDEVHTAMTSMTEILLPLAIKRSPNYTSRAYGYLVHELGHHERDDIFKIGPVLAKNKKLGNIFNFVEDGFMERHQADLNYGDREILSRAYTQHHEATLSNIKDNPELMTDDVSLMGAMRMMCHARSDWDERAMMLGDELKKVFDPKHTTMYEELIDEGWVNKLQGIPTVEESAKIAVDLYQRLYPDELTDEEAEQIKDAITKASNDEGEEEGQGSEGSEDGDGQSEGEEALAKSGKRAEDKEKGEGGVKSPMNWRDLSSDHDFDEAPGRGGGVDWSDNNAKQFFTEYDMIKEKRYKGTGKTAPVYSTLSAQIRTYLQAQSRTKIVPEKDRGRIYKRNLVRLGMPPIDKGRWNKQIFYTQDYKTNMDTVVQLLIDGSGSMWGQPIERAKESAVNLAHVLDSIHIPYGTAVFNTTWGAHNIHILKAIDERVNCNAIHTRFDTNQIGGGNNNDSDSILWAQRQLSSRREHRKVIVVLNDGMPAAGGWSGPATKAVVEEIYNARGYEIYGIGIMDDSVKYFYPKYKVIHSANEIEGALLELLKEALKQ